MTSSYIDPSSETLMQATNQTIELFPPRGGIDKRDFCRRRQPLKPKFELPSFITWVIMFNEELGEADVDYSKGESSYDIMNLILSPPQWIFEYPCRKLDDPMPTLFRGEFFNLLQSCVADEQFEASRSVPVVRPHSLIFKALNAYLAYLVALDENSTELDQEEHARAGWYNIERLRTFHEIKYWFEFGDMGNTAAANILDLNKFYKAPNSGYSSDGRKSVNQELILLLSKPSAKVFCRKDNWDDTAPSFRFTLCISKILLRMLFPQCFRRDSGKGWGINQGIQEEIKVNGTYFPDYNRKGSAHNEEQVEKQLQAFYCWLSYDTRWSEDVTEDALQRVDNNDFEGGQEGPPYDWFLKMGMLRESDLVQEFAKLHREKGKTDTEIEEFRLLNTIQLENERV